MKTERRHELETNALAKEFARRIDLIKPYSKAVAGVVFAALVIFAVAMFVTRKDSDAEAAAWNAYYQATEGGQPQLDDLLAVAKAQRGTSVEPWARIAWADGQLRFGSRLLFRNRDVAKQFLEEAHDEYRQLQDDGNHEMIRQRATYGLARASESLSRLDEARDEYLKLVEKVVDGKEVKVDGVFTEAARRQGNLLEEGKSKAFYDWFVVAKLPQPFSPGDPGAPGQKPDFSVGNAEGELNLDDVQAPITPSPATQDGTSAAADEMAPNAEAAPRSSEPVETGSAAPADSTSEEHSEPSSATAPAVDRPD